MTDPVSKPIARRIFQIVLFGNLVGLVMILGFAWWSLDELEKTSIHSENHAELENFQLYGDKNKPQQTHTSQLISVYQPLTQANREALPVIFQNVPVPFEGEIEFLGSTYSVATYAFPEGTLYIAKNIRLFEQHAQVLMISVLLLALLILIASFILAFIASRKISRPILNFTDMLAQLQHERVHGKVPTRFVDAELNQIATAINGFIEQLEDNIKREKTLVSMASHELRTPVAVILGAANIIESRNRLADDDKKTLQRIITAAREMSSNIQSLLNLVRKTRDAQPAESFELAALLSALCADYTLENPDNARRLLIQPPASPQLVQADKALVRMLLHNLISNSLNHTHGRVSVILQPGYIDIIDEGNAAALEGSQSPGLGLYIVSLACEALGWRQEWLPHPEGSCIRLWIKPA